MGNFSGTARNSGMTKAATAAPPTPDDQTVGAFWPAPWRRAELIAYSIVALSLLASLVIQATSIQMDASLDGVELDWREPWILEATSHLTLLAFAAIVPILLRAAPLEGPGLGRAVAIHFLGAATFSFLHGAGMFLMRDMLFPSVLGRPYELDYFNAKVIIYELRKDLFTYGLFLFGFWAIGAAQARIAASAPQQSRRIALQCGKRSIFLDAADIQFVKSAGNYVEATTAAKTYLARMTLGDLEGRLAEVGAPHLRVHRSYLVNPAEIREIAPTGEGGVTITLNSGATILGSRSYRERLEAAVAASGGASDADQRRAGDPPARVV